MYIGEAFVDVLDRIEEFACTDSVSDIQIDGHIRRISEIAETGVLWKHDFRRAIVFMDLWPKYLEIVKGNVNFDRVFSYRGFETFFIDNMYWIKHTNRAFNLKIGEIVI